MKQPTPELMTLLELKVEKRSFSVPFVLKEFWLKYQEIGASESSAEGAAGLMLVAYSDRPDWLEALMHAQEWVDTRVSIADLSQEKPDKFIRTMDLALATLIRKAKKQYVYKAIMDGENWPVVVATIPTAQNQVHRQKLITELESANLSLTESQTRGQEVNDSAEKMEWAGAYSRALMSVDTLSGLLAKSITLNELVLAQKSLPALR